MPDSARPKIFAPKNIISALAWSADKVFSNWAALVTYLGGGTLLGALAWLQRLSPLFLGGAFFLGLLLVAVVRAISAYARGQDARAAYLQARAAPPTTVNPLRRNFEREKISLLDFDGAYTESRIYTDKVFRDCDFYGPGSLIFWHGCSLNSPGFLMCDMICVTSAPVFSAIAFKDCSFINCRFFSITLLLPRNVIQDHIIPDLIRGGRQVPIIIGFNEVASADESDQSAGI